MNAIATHCRLDRPAALGKPLPAKAAMLLDPLDDDAPDDGIVVTTRRGLTRLALVASETGARFAREGIELDPMRWLLAPRRLFGGEAAVDAALAREDCMRAVLVHGLGLGLDAEPADVDDLVRGGEDGLADADELGSTSDRSGDAPEAAAPRLFTAVIAGEDAAASGQVLAFDALICGSAAELRERIVRRVGPALADLAVVREGFDASEPVATVLVSKALADQLAHAEAAPSSAIAAGLDVVVQQRFAA